jgi:hypothetical protein
LLAVLLGILAVFGGTRAPASGAPGELRVAEEGAWHADRNFELDWEPSPPPGPATEAVYRLYDSEGETVRALTRPLSDLLDPFWVPPVPGVYALEAWLQDATGAHGPHSTATLRFDDRAPASPSLLGPQDWVLGIDAAAVAIGPCAPLPLSGIRGYAVSVDRSGGSSPCAGIRCEPDEIDLAGGEGGTISLGTLPEGVNFVRAVAVSGAGVSSPVATAKVRVDGSPPLLSLHPAPAGWSAGPVRVTAQATDSLSGMAAAGPLGPFTAIAVDGSAPARAFGGAVATWASGSGIHRVEAFARDAAGNVGGSGPGAQPTTTIRIDENPPAVAFSSAQDPVEPERLEAFVTDALSGPSQDQGWIGVRPAGTAARFERLPTQVAGEKLIARWDSDSYPSGRYEFLATGFDAAGNAARGTNRTSGGKMVLANPLKTQVELKAGLSRLRFAGRLRGSNAGAVTGQEIVVTEAFAAGAKPQRRITVVRTRADGGFSLRLRPGPSREVTAGFAGSRTLTRASSESLRLEVPASVRLRVSTASARIGGTPVVFSGRVAATGAEATALKGLPVELQFRYRGGSWSEFRTVETNRRGRFRYAYRFSDDDSRGIRFQFRAYVKGREGWPYGPGTSRPVSVTGR